MDYKETGLSVRVPAKSRPSWYRTILSRMISWLTNISVTQRSIGMIAGTNLVGIVIGVIGSFVQAHFIAPDQLGFIRKYSVVSGYAIFFSLGLFIILQREFAVLIGKGEKEKAYRTVAIVQSWCLLVTTILCSGLAILSILELFHGHWPEAAAWFIQVIAVWSTLYTGFLDSTFRSGSEFERRSKGKFLGTIGTAATIPVFWLWPFPAFVLRSVLGSVVSSFYLHIYRPVKVGWCLPWREFLVLVKRGMRLFASDYLRYNFWLTIEIWLMLKFGGDRGVGLLVFSAMMVDMSAQVSTAINMVYIPQLAQRYGKTEKIISCLKLAVKPTLLSLGISVVVILAFWFLLPPIVRLAFPKYLPALPMINILVMRILLISLTLPLFMLTILESYVTRFVATIAGLGTFVGAAFALNGMGFSETAVPWGTLLGQLMFTVICLAWLGAKVVAQQRKEVAA